MTTIFMGTNPDAKGWRKQFWKMIEDLDIHKWTIGFEVGKDGYKHLQFRVQVSKDEKEGFEAIKKYLPSAHLEVGSNKWGYERKSGRFLSSDDTPEIRQVRFGKLKEWQETALERLKTQGIREIDVYVDECGGMGKSHFINYLYETGKAHYIPPYCSTIEKLVQTTASLYLKQGWRDILAIDIPRAYKWSEQLYTAIESIKDGLIMEPRYEAQPINIRGVRIIIMCNVSPNREKLSADRWRIYERPPHS